MSNRILVIGARGQIGTELTTRLREIHGSDTVIASDLRDNEDEFTRSGPFEKLDVLDKAALADLVDKHHIGEIYLMAAMLSATAEKYPNKAWELNMNSLFHVLDLARDGKISKVFWPSSIAVFGPGTPREHTPQSTVMDPTTVYGISKLAGERWCEYYNRNFGVDVRSIRYPGLISYKTPPGGGTTDYAVDIFHQALSKGHYTSFLGPETTLPMMYMDDAIRATISIMERSEGDIAIRSSYNLAGISFSPKEIAGEIRKHLSEFQIDYAPDFRQQIADSWPDSIDDSAAREDWGWKHEYGLEELVSEMLTNLRP
jgi:nucleoside-diphosphate-sugar epimerase